jgi:hypothetical protein
MTRMDEGSAVPWLRCTPALGWKAIALQLTPRSSTSDGSHDFFCARPERVWGSSEGAYRNSLGVCDVQYCLSGCHVAAPQSSWRGYGVTQVGCPLPRHFPSPMDCVRLTERLTGQQSQPRALEVSDSSFFVGRPSGTHTVSLSWQLTRGMGSPRTST